MSHYHFGRFGVMLRDDHPLAIYAGKRRLSPGPFIVWWWPINWVVFTIVFPIALFTAIWKELWRRK